MIIPRILQGKMTIPRILQGKMAIPLNIAKGLVSMFMIIWSLDFVLYNIGQNAQFGDRICFLL
jgi:hypothetical protein